MNPDYNKKYIDKYIHLAGDPHRTESSLNDLLAKAPDLYNKPEILRYASILFGASRFLANYCISNPDALENAVRLLKKPVDKDYISGYIAENPCPMDIEGAMRYLRRMKKRMILCIALRDLSRQGDLPEITLELSWLAEALIETALVVAQSLLRTRFGEPDKNKFAVIGLGKLGGSELNFSSDVDLMYVYDNEAGETSGILSSSGVRRNRISSHEYYCRLAETIGKLLASDTSDGFAHRVDLRLRPGGTRGELALCLAAYELYYESYGRGWERAALIRARPVAGDQGLGEDFLKTIKPFVYRKYLDYSSVDELKNMKLSIDSTAHKYDIKRGVGGIREIEFFTHSFQLIYGGREPLLRNRNTLKALHILNQKGLLAYQDLQSLTEAYIFLRTLEHRLQMRHDLQTHTMPREDEERDILARVMNFPNRQSLEDELQKHRNAVHSIFLALFHDEDAVEAEEEESRLKEAALFSGDSFGEKQSIEAAIRKTLAGYNVFIEPEKAVKNLNAINESLALHQTIRTRRQLLGILPGLFQRVKESSDPDQALDNLQSFLNSIGPNESYISVLAESTPLSGHLITLFAESQYLSRLLIANPNLIDVLREQGIYGNRTLAALKRDLEITIRHSADWASALRRFKLMEEVRLGLLYLNGEICLRKLLRGLTKTAEAILDEAFIVADRDLSAKMTRPSGSMVVIGLGKLGGWELSYGSDLDIIFIHSGSGQGYFTKLAEKMINVLSTYTKEGIAYKVDTRLRPTGRNGPLVQDIHASRRYYIEGAELWERQALLRARPVAGDLSLGADFFRVTRQAVAISAGHKDLANSIRNMRERIQAELSRETDHYDLKLGYGGLNELEFMIQYLQLKHVGEKPEVVVPNTPLAIRRLMKYGFLSQEDADDIESIYFFYREIETMIRLMGISAMPKEGPDLASLARKQHEQYAENLAASFLNARKNIRTLWNAIVV